MYIFGILVHKKVIFSFKIFFWVFSTKLGTLKFRKPHYLKSVFPQECFLQKWNGRNNKICDFHFYFFLILDKLGMLKFRKPHY